MPVERVTRTIRLPADLAGDIDAAAGVADLSVNRWIIGALRSILEVSAELADWENEKARLTAARSMLSSMPKHVADAHADRYPPPDPFGKPDPAMPAPISDRLPHRRAAASGNPKVTGRPVGSFDPDTDTPT